MTRQVNAGLEAPPDSEQRLRAADGTDLHYQVWLPERNAGQAARAGILLVPGYGEHQGRYGGMARRLNALGYAVGGGDHRGMGRSGGLRAFVGDFAEYLDDLALFEARFRSDLPDGLPLFVYGHSLGGLLALRHAERHPAAAIVGTILSAPLLGVHFTVPGWQMTLGRIAARLRPTHRLATPLDPTILTHDPDAQADLARDPLMLHHATLGGVMATDRAMTAAHHEIAALAWPTLWLIPGDDKLCNALASRALFDALPNAERHTWREYPGLYHNLLEERPADRDRVFADLQHWLDAMAST